MNKKNIIIIIGIILALCIIGVCTYLVLDKSNSVKTEKGNTEQKQETKKTKKEETDATSKATEKADETDANSKPTEKVDQNNVKDFQYEGDSHFPDFKKIVTKSNDVVNETVDLNAKNIVISIENTSDYSKSIAKTIGKINDVEIFNQSLYGEYYSKIYYRVIKGNDSKDYLLIGGGNYYIGEVFKIYNDEGKELYEFSTRYSELNHDVIPKNRYLITIENNTVYYYKYMNSSNSQSNSNKPVEMEKIKLIINNNTIQEETTGIKVEGYFGQMWS